MTGEKASAEAFGAGDPSTPASRGMSLGVVALGDLMTDPVTGTRMTSAEKHLLAIEFAVRAEAAGLDRFHVGEHHAMEYVISAPPVLLSAIATHTSRIRLGTGVTLLANLDPVRVAEDYATVDILSGGRLEIIGGRGNQFPSMFELFGIPLEESPERFEEGLRLLLEIWSGEPVTWKGQVRAPMSEVRVEPTPVQRPHPPVWVGGGLSQQSADLSAELGLPLMLPIVTFQPPAPFAPVAERYRERCAAPRVGAVVHAAVTRRSQELAERFQPRYRAYHAWAGDIMIGPDKPKPAFMQHLDYEAMTAPDGPAVVGSPAEVVDRLGKLRELLGAETFLFCMDFGGIPRDELLDMVDLIGSEVVPQLA